MRKEGTINWTSSERTEQFYVELAVVLYNSGASLRKTQRVLDWLGVSRVLLSTTQALR